MLGPTCTRAVGSLFATAVQVCRFGAPRWRAFGRPAVAPASYALDRPRSLQ